MTANSEGNRSTAPIILGILVLVLALGCAEVVAPPGGEPDKTGPRLIASNPPNGTTNIPIGNEIRLQFSERIVKPTTGKPVFISPRPQTEPKVKWHSDNLEIEFDQPFADSTTYIISVDANITDLRNNKLDSNLTIAFSTGPSLDPGHLGGIISENNQPRGGLLVGLYRRDGLPDTVAYDSIYPDYLTQTNAEGRFGFEFLPEREYRLVAFNDRNRNERFEPSREEFAVPDRPIVVGDSLLLDSLSMGLKSIEDTAAIQVVSALMNQNNMLRIRLSRPVPMDLLSVSPANLLLQRIDDSTRVVGAEAILETTQDTSRTINAYCGVVDSGWYRIVLTYDEDRKALVRDSLEVLAAPDQAPPTISSFEPVGGTWLPEDLEIVVQFSEPVDTSSLTPATFVLSDDVDNVISVTPVWRDALTVDLQPSSLPVGATVRMVITEFELADLAGNILGDSLREFAFSTYDPEDLGAIAGEIAIEIPGREYDPVVLRFQKVGGEVIEESVDSRSFRVSVPDGKYLLSGFVDSDFDGRRSLGSVVPWVPAETVGSFPDTIAVRSRFETSGIELRIR